MLDTNLLQMEIFKNYNDEELFQEEEKLRFSLLADMDDIESLGKLASLLFYKRELEPALKLFKKLIKLDPKTESWYGFSGYIYYEKEKYEDAILYLEKALEISPDSPFIYFLLGNAYSRVGNIREATINYDLAIFLGFDIYKAHLHFANKYEDLGEYRKAVEEYIIAYEIDPRDFEVKNKIEELSKKHIRIS